MNQIEQLKSAINFLPMTTTRMYKRIRSIPVPWKTNLFCVAMRSDAFSLIANYIAPMVIIFKKYYENIPLYYNNYDVEFTHRDYLLLYVYDHLFNFYCI